MSKSKTRLKMHVQLFILYIYIYIWCRKQYQRAKPEDDLSVDASLCASATQLTLSFTWFQVVTHTHKPNVVHRSIGYSTAVVRMLMICIFPVSKQRHIFFASISKFSYSVQNLRFPSLPRNVIPLRFHTRIVMLYFYNTKCLIFQNELKIQYIFWNVPFREFSFFFNHISYTPKKFT